MRTPRNTLTHLSATPDGLLAERGTLAAICGARVDPTRIVFTLGDGPQAPTCQRCREIGLGEAVRRGTTLSTHHPRCQCWECTGRSPDQEEGDHMQQIDDGRHSSDSLDALEPTALPSIRDKGPFVWCDNTYATVEDLQFAIQGDLADYLCNSDAGSVEHETAVDQEGEPRRYQLEIIVRVIAHDAATQTEIDNENEAAGVAQAERDLNGDSGGSSFEQQQSEARRVK